jgi:hypothetical protein
VYPVGGPDPGHPDSAYHHWASEEPSRRSPRPFARPLCPGRIQVVNHL